MSISNFLNFLVNNILYFELVKDGKFRKNFSVFDLKESIDEIIAVPKYKSEQLNITIFTKYLNFDELSKSI